MGNSDGNKLLHPPYVYLSYVLLVVSVKGSKASRFTGVNCFKTSDASPAADPSENVPATGLPASLIPYAPLLLDGSA